MGRALEYRVRVRIVRRIWIVGEERGIHLNVQNGTNISQTSSTVCLQGPAKGPAPQVFTGTRSLELSGYRHRTHKVKIQSFERRIIGLQLTNSLDGSSLEVPNVHSEHSRLN
jgi:hypothetical protein